MRTDILTLSEAFVLASSCKRSSPEAASQQSSILPDRPQIDLWYREGTHKELESAVAIRWGLVSWLDQNGQIGAA
jgi:hypothetical protein